MRQWLIVAAYLLACVVVVALLGGLFVVDRLPAWLPLVTGGVMLAWGVALVGRLATAGTATRS